MKLLIIDDEPNIRHMMRLTLEAAKYDVDEAADGREGLARFGDGRGYEAVVLDQKMPGLDGLETLRRIKEAAPDACVLMVTAYASVELAVDAMRAGAMDFLRKPMTPETLRSAVAAAIANKPTRQPFRRAVDAAPQRPVEIAVLTLNGFQILRSGEPPSPASGDHTFCVRHVPDGVEVLVTVGIDPEAVDRVARLTNRRLEAASGFWRLQAERLLSTWVWVEGRAPIDQRLVVRDVSREDLEVAARWEDA
jgi:CheY-like chemotaxis protein